MFKGRRLDAALSSSVKDPERQSDHLLVIVAVHLSSHHLTELGEINVARVVRVKLVKNIENLFLRRIHSLGGIQRRKYKR